MGRITLPRGNFFDVQMVRGKAVEKKSNTSFQFGIQPKGRFLMWANESGKSCWTTHLSILYAVILTLLVNSMYRGQTKLQAKH